LLWVIRDSVLRTGQAGDRAPEFILKDANGREVSSRELLAKGPLVVTFYRGVWCPYCNIDLQALVAARFGLRFRLPDYLIELYRDTFKNDLSHTNGDSSWTLPMPARYVISTDGVIGYAEVNPDYTRRPDPEELLPVLSALKSKVAA